MRATVFRMVGCDEIKSTAHQFGPASRKRQPETDSATSAGICVATSPKRLENTTKLPLIDARARIHHIHTQIAIVGRKLDEDVGGLAAARVTTCIVDQDACNLIDKASVCSEGLAIRYKVRGLDLHAVIRTWLLRGFHHDTEQRIGV